jgi:hypothetical protein
MDYLLVEIALHHSSPARCVISSNKAMPIRLAMPMTARSRHGDGGSGSRSNHSLSISDTSSRLTDTPASRYSPDGASAHPAAAPCASPQHSGAAGGRRRRLPVLHRVDHRLSVFVRAMFMSRSSHFGLNEQPKVLGWFGPNWRRFTEDVAEKLVSAELGRLVRGEGNW